MAPKFANIMRRFRRSAPPEQVAETMARVDNRAMNRRGWDAAKTDRTNQYTWLEADGAHINRLIETELETIWRRVHSELLNNAMLAGVLDSFKNDFVGDRGPQLQVISDNTRFNEALEDVWEETWEQIDATGNMSGPELLKMMLHQWCARGESFLLETTDRQATTTVQYRVAAIDPIRVRTSWEHLGDMNWLAGIGRTRKGKVIGYDVTEPLPLRLEASSTSGYAWAFNNFSADEIIHQYRIDEPEQIRGYPWFTPCLQTSADLRDFDTRLLQAMRLVASQTVLWETNNPQLTPWAGSEGFVLDIEPNSMASGPPGWTANQLKPENPTPVYAAFRNERHRELGRPLSMPLLMIRAGAEEHNFSSARFDAQQWQRAVRTIQRMTERVTLNRMLTAVAREASLAPGRPGQRNRFALPRAPRRVRFLWNWPSLPHVDPKKEADADAINYQNGFVTLTSIAAKHNMTLEELLTTRAREQSLLVDMGLQITTQPNGNEETDDDETENETDENETSQPQTTQPAAAQ